MKILLEDAFHPASTVVRKVKWGTGRKTQLRWDLQEGAVTVEKAVIHSPVHRPLRIGSCLLRYELMLIQLMSLNLRRQLAEVTTREEIKGYERDSNQFVLADQGEGTRTH